MLEVLRTGAWRLQGVGKRVAKWGTRASVTAIEFSAEVMLGT
jgi:hypothetical protein